MFGLSIVIPVFNEEQNIFILHQEIRNALGHQKRPFEIIFVDDGSVDNSLHQIKKLGAADPAVKYISFQTNYGQSAALKSGFDHANYEITVTMDADLQNDPADIPKLLHFSNDYQMVNGLRKFRKDTAAKRFGSKIGNFVRNKLTNENIQDTGCSLKAMNTEMLKRIKAFKGFHRFLPTLMRLEGAKVIEVPVNHRERQYGYSKYTNFKRAFSGLHDTISVRWMMKRHIKEEIKEKNV